MTRLFEFFPEELRRENRPEPQKPAKSVDQLNYAFPRLKKLPLNSIRQVKSAMTDLNKVKGVSELELVQACKKIIERAAQLEICTIGFLENYGHLLT